MLDAVLAIAHHLAVFGLAMIIAMELVLLRPGIAGDRLLRLARIDSAYGGIATLAVLIGIARVIWGDKGYEFYVGNWTFWAKMASFVLVALLSIQPTIKLVGWRRATAADPNFIPADADVRQSRRFVHLQAAVFFLIPLFAALMARGIGY